MTFNATEYRKRVLVPFRGPRLPELQGALRELKNDAAVTVPSKLDVADLYDVTPQMTDPEIAVQVSAVSQVFTKGAANIKDIAASLKELHDLLVARNPDLTRASFWQRQLGERDQRSRAQLAGFAQDVSKEFAILGLVTPPKLRQLARGARIPDSIPDTELAAAATKAGLQVVPEIAAPRVTVPTTVSNDLTKTTCSSLVEAIFLEQVPGSFSVLDGFRAENRVPLTLDQVKRARGQTDLRQSNNDDWIKKVLGGVLLAAKTDADLQGLLVAHFIDLGRRAARESTLQVMALKALTETGLDRKDAARILLQFSEVGDSAGFPDVQAKVASGHLREARRLFDALVDQLADAETDQRTKTQAALERAEERLETLRTQARAALEAGDIDAAAKALNEAQTVCADDEALDEAARSLPPSAPLQLSVAPGPDGRVVVITWSPGFGSTEDIWYRVIRKPAGAPRNAQDGELVAAQVADTRLEDPQAPVATELYYAVAASRGGGYSPVATRAVTLLPPVSNVTVTVDVTSVALSWRTPPGAQSVSVVQISPDGTRVAVPVNAHSGASMSGLSTGTNYTYVLTAHYLGTSGNEVGSLPVRVVGVPRGTARPVPSLTVRQCGDANGTPQVEGTWQEISGFGVEVWSFAHLPAWPYGARVPMSALPGPGQRLTGVAAGGGRRQGVRGPAEPGLRHYLAITRDGDDGIVGQRQELGICPPLRGVHGERFRDVVLLSWEWPGDEFDVRVRWSGPGGSGETSVNRVQYGQQGGLRIPAGTAGTRFVLTTEPADATDQWTSIAYTLDVPAAATALRYAVKWRRRPLRPPEAELTFSASGPLDPIGVVVVGKEGTVMPYNATDGIVVERRNLEFRDSLNCTLTVTLPKLGRHFWVRAFSAQPDRVRLVDPPTTELRGA